VEWRYTGGPHGGWGSGSAWSSVDFAPSEDRPGGLFCYTSTTWITAIAPGVIARSNEGAVVLDLDGDGDESTGWTIMYLHISSEERVQAGIRVNAGDRIGHPSCEGGVSMGNGFLPIVRLACRTTRCRRFQWVAGL
jgi:murein DD-endopeptidase MepM/ murein hydrolase activator NlpD